jgi:hypothetical protein
MWLQNKGEHLFTNTMNLLRYQDSLWGIQDVGKLKVVNLRNYA